MISGKTDAMCTRVKTPYRGQEAPEVSSSFECILSDRYVTQFESTRF